jgi:hypothetical protein
MLPRRVEKVVFLIVSGIPTPNGIRNRWLIQHAFCVRSRICYSNSLPTLLMLVQVVGIEGSGAGG